MEKGLFEEVLEITNLKEAGKIDTAEGITYIVLAEK